MSKFFLSLIVLCICVCPCNVYALSFTTYTNHYDWAMAVGDHSIQNFNNESNGSFTSRNFGGFRADLINSSGNLPAISNGELILQSFTEGHSYLRLIFSTAIRALYFTWRNTDADDSIELNIAGTLWSFGMATGGFPAAGTFAIIAQDGAFTWLDLYDPTGGGGILTYGYLDNVYYSTEVNPVPEPASFALFSYFFIVCVLWKKIYHKSVKK